MTNSEKNEKRVKWTLMEVPVKSLKNHPKNPRQIGKDQFDRLGKLIDKFGLIDKPIINQDMTIIGGHQRVKYFKKIKSKSVECLVSDRLLSDEDVDELCIGLNLHQGIFDYDVLANMWNPVDLLKYGFTEKQLFDCCEEVEKIMDEIKEEKNSNKKKKSCPNCGHEF